MKSAFARNTLCYPRKLLLPRMFGQFLIEWHSGLHWFRFNALSDEKPTTPSQPIRWRKRKPSIYHLITRPAGVSCNLGSLLFACSALIGSILSTIVRCVNFSFVYVGGKESKFAPFDCLLSELIEAERRLQNMGKIFRYASLRQLTKDITMTRPEDEWVMMTSSVIVIDVISLQVVQ